MVLAINASVDGHVSKSMCTISNDDIDDVVRDKNIEWFLIRSNEGHIQETCREK